MTAALFDLTGRRALVTGASRGIGARLALALAEAGADVALTARSAAALDEVAAAVTATGRRAVPLAADAADEAAAGPAVRAAAAALGGPVDILVNNAGIEEVRAAAEVEAALWDRILGVNLRGAFFMARAAARELLAAGRGGAIVNVCSLTSYVGVPAAAPYTASKAGLLGLTRALAAEWAASGIRVNGIAPGYFRTALTEPFYADDAWQARMLAKIPMGRFGALDDLAGAAVFLAADASRYMTGQCLVIDGGYLASI
ncbi:MAG: glucose 1-dehydrogenase [Rhodobacteraceae bacterium]|jgi:NAD(P)-dependent dehydrogenase (short-subunit alcohol dehydrogenase family)|nr:glucose 1-dehydrogenase [Paracoccaceae bacterium]